MGGYNKDFEDGESMMNNPASSASNKMSPQGIMNRMPRPGFQQPGGNTNTAIGRKMRTLQPGQSGMNDNYSEYQNDIGSKTGA